ncbi:aromatase/cyclase [Tumebacillus sp. DT12]|uniref:Aromatase/cyclase n=1 Tax=Tumebacillus lacus TaxID=2995335 RepID=A0ABT3X6M8_9BACL|nr:aromatase/cyclase [Tumebacillus lacus]MCX7571311.1 aromatase/cyclase [Tumebacillus lacus]
MEVSETMRGDRHRVYELIADMESYPRFMPSLHRVEVLERGEDWTVTAWDTSINGMRFRWQERDVFDRENWRIGYSQVAGDLKRFEGEWRVEETAGEVKVTLVVDFDFGVPMLQALLNPVAALKLRQNGESMLRALKSRCEGTGEAGAPDHG